MERDLADDLDDLICAGTLSFGSASFDLNIVAIVLVIWIIVAVLVYLAAVYLVQSDTNRTEQVKSQEKIREDEEKPVKIEALEAKIEETKSVENVDVSAQEITILNSSVAIDKADAPQTLGSDLEAVGWVNQTLENIYSTSSLRATLIQQWLTALTNYTKLLDIEENVSISYEGILPLQTLPKFTSFITQIHPNDNMTSTMDVELKEVSIQAKFFDGKSEKLCTIFLKHLRGRASATILSRERVINAKLEGWPEIHLEIRTGRNEIPNEMIDIMKELTVSSLRGSQVNVNMEDFGNGSVQNPFPVFLRKPTNIEPPPSVAKTPSPKVDPDSRPRNMYPTLRKKAKRFLHVCVAKVVNLGGAVSTTTPYVVTELDEPNQRHQTDVTKLIGGSDAYWNQTFTFELSNLSKEVLFEVWNKADQELEMSKDEEQEQFLGLGIVSVDELMLKQTQRLVVPLQGIPEIKASLGMAEENTAVFGGLLTVHFLVTPDQSIADLQLEATNGFDEIKTTDETADEVFGAPSRAARMRNRRDGPNRFKKRLSASASVGRSETSLAESSRPASVSATPGSKRRSAMMSKLNDQLNQFITGIRAMSADRVRSASQNRGAASALSSLMKNSEDGDSQSDLSGISAASNKTYITEESSLVLECREKGVIKHYLIPYHVAKRGRIGKRGTKLHIYMDHIFVANHVKSGTPCDVCLTSIPMRLGKQAYICRNCHLTSHKPCHIKTPEHCLDTTLPQMELLFMEGGKI